MRLRRLDRLKYKSQSEQPTKLNEFGSDEEKDLKEEDDYEGSEYTTKDSLLSLPRLMTLFFVCIIVLTVGGSILSEVTDSEPGEYTTGAHTESLKGIENLSNWLEVIALVLAATFVIGILMTYLGGFCERRNEDD